MELHPLEVLRRPVITEKYTALQDRNKYAFEVHRKSNKKQIRDAVELAFPRSCCQCERHERQGQAKARRREDICDQTVEEGRGDAARG